MTRPKPDRREPESMGVYADGERSLRVVDEFPGGVGWQVAEEAAERTSHALATGEGVWLLDPIDAPGVGDLLADRFGSADGAPEVAGVAVLSNYHARDAGVFARRHGVPVHVPAWVDRVPARVDAPVREFAGELGATGLRARKLAPLPGWRAAVAYDENRGTLYVPDVLGTADAYTVGPERLGVYLLRRPLPPRSAFADVTPERVLCGHGAGVFENADGALRDALAGARRRFPRALLAGGRTQLRALVAAQRDRYRE